MKDLASGETSKQDETTSNSTIVNMRQTEEPRRLGNVDILKGRLIRVIPLCLIS